MSAVDSILLIAFGGPESPDEIRPFLRIVTEGRNIPPERIEEVAHHYELTGGRSPLNEITFRQADALRSVLESDGIKWPVFVGMRNWRPFLDRALADMKGRGHRRGLGIILSAFQTEASWDRYMRDVASARDRVGPGAPEIQFSPAWSQHPRFIEAVTQRVSHVLARLPHRRRDAVPVVFTAHSVPTSMAAASPYVAQFTAAAKAVAQRLDHPRWLIAYQSRSGPPREPWLDPDICSVVRDLGTQGAKDVVVVPIGFVCEHVEILYDLDIEARKVAEEAGLRFHRPAPVNDHPAFIRMLADLVRQGLAD